MFIDGITVIEDPIFGEYFIEEIVDLPRLREPMKNHNPVGIRPCQDVYVGVKDSGVLTVERLCNPAINERWPIGGALYRGHTTRDSINKTVKRETNLDTIGTAFLLGTARIFSNYNRSDKETDKGSTLEISLARDKLKNGTDNTAWIFFVEGKGEFEGKGELKLDEDHQNPLFTKPEECTNEFLKSLNPYVGDFLPKALEVYKRKVA